MEVPEVDTWGILRRQELTCLGGVEKISGFYTSGRITFRRTENNDETTGENIKPFL